MNVLILLSLIGCGEENSGNTESGMPYCAETETSLTASEESPMGVKMEDFINELPMNYSVWLEWEDGEKSCFYGAVSIDPDTVRYVESTAVYPTTGGPVPSIDVECENYMAADGFVSFSTENGEISEEHVVSFKISEADPGDPLKASYSIITDTLAGSLNPASSVENGDTANYQINGTVSSSEFSGTLYLETMSENGDFGWGERTLIGAWGENVTEGCDLFE